jgi:hypothetical protein
LRKLAPTFWNMPSTADCRICESQSARGSATHHILTETTATHSM